MIKLNNVTIKTNKGRTLVENLTLTVNKGDKLAIIGEEGNGKSTILKAIFNKGLITDYCMVSGLIYMLDEKLGLLEQKLPNKWLNYNVVDYLITNEETNEEEFSIYEKFAQADKYFKLLNVDRLIEENPKISILSGGEKIKLQLAKLLLNQATALLLDEPTNDLDIETLNWLQKFIKEYNNPIIFISHDEIMLEQCANQILHIEQLVKKSSPRHTLAKTNYLQYVADRNLSITKQTQVALNERRVKAKKQAILMQIKQKVENALNKAIRDPISGRLLAKKMANVKAQESRFESEELTEIPETEEAIKLIVDKTICIPQQKQVLNLHIKELKAGGKILCKNICFKVCGPQKVAIIGKNGAGKTTMIKEIFKEMQKVQGLKVGCFSQNYYENLNYNKTPVEEITFPNMDYNARTVLGSLKFTADEMNSKISNLSEGQKAKLLLLKLIVEKNNVLLLDEPTRNLSPLSKPVIRSVLKEYHGAIITVSHDRKFIDEVCNEVYQLTPECFAKCKDNSFT